MKDKSLKEKILGPTTKLEERDQSNTILPKINLKKKKDNSEHQILVTQCWRVDVQENTKNSEQIYLHKLACGGTTATEERAHIVPIFVINDWHRRMRH